MATEGLTLLMAVLMITSVLGAGVGTVAAQDSTETDDESDTYTGTFYDGSYTPGDTGATISADGVTHVESVTLKGVSEDNSTSGDVTDTLEITVDSGGNTLATHTLEIQHGEDVGDVSFDVGEDIIAEDNITINHSTQDGALSASASGVSADGTYPVETYTVHADGSADYTNIQNATADARPGYIIDVQSDLTISGSSETIRLSKDGLKIRGAAPGDERLTLDGTGANVPIVRSYSTVGAVSDIEVTGFEIISDTNPVGIKGGDEVTLKYNSLQTNASDQTILMDAYASNSGETTTVTATHNQWWANGSVVEPMVDAEGNWDQSGHYTAGYPSDNGETTVTVDPHVSDSGFTTLSDGSTVWKGSLEATINDDGTAVEGATVELYEPDAADDADPVATADTDADGLATFSGLNTGDYDIVVTHADHSDLEDSVTINADSTATLSMDYADAGSGVSGTGDGVGTEVIMLIGAVITILGAFGTIFALAARD